MRRNLVVILLFCLLGSVLVNAFPVKPETPFKGGEKIRFGIMFKWGAVNTELAYADMTLTDTQVDGEPCYHLKLSARTSPFYDTFYHVRENFESWFSKDDQRPVKCTRDTEEGNYTAWNRYTYDWVQKVIHADVNFNGRGDEHYEIPLSKDVYDLPTLVYHFRTIDASGLKGGERFPFRFAIDDAVFDITLTFVGRETKKVRKIGMVKTLHFNCSVVGGALFEGDKPVEIWLADDGTCMPVAFMAPLRVGAMQGWLKNYQGLKYNFDALVQ